MSEVLPEQFDPVLHSGPRITILSRMAIRQRMRFSALQRSTTLTPGNLATHLDVLVKAGYLAFEATGPAVQRQKVVLLTPAGDAAFRGYLAQVKALLHDVQASLPT